MLIEIILFIILGIATGTITGLIPGIHTNLVSTAILSISASALLFLNPIYLVVFIVSMSITHTFVDFIPSVLLGCPDTDTELSILPGHQMLKEGRGYEAILLSNYGGLLAIFILILITLPSIIVIPKIHTILMKEIPLTIQFIQEVSFSVLVLFLILISILLISLEKKKSLALIAFTLSGLLGLSVLNLDMKEPLLPLLTGLFGSSMLIESIKTKVKIPEQNMDPSKFDLDKIGKSVASAFLGSFVASPMLSLLPGLGSGQAAIIGDTLSRKIQNIKNKIKNSTQKKESDPESFIVLIGATNTLVMSFSFVTLYLISRTRTGSAAAIGTLIKEISFPLFILIIIAVLLSGIISFFITTSLAKIMSRKINKLNYSKISGATLIFLTGMILLISGISGIAIFIISTLTGIYCISLGVRRTNMMGCLLLPTIIFYLRI